MNRGYRDSIRSGSLHGFQAIFPVLCSLLLFSSASPSIASTQTLFDRTAFAFPNMDLGSFAWGDFEDDGRLDLALAGLTENGSLSSLCNPLQPITGPSKRWTGD